MDGLRVTCTRVTGFGSRLTHPEWDSSTRAIDSAVAHLRMARRLGRLRSRCHRWPAEACLATVMPSTATDFLQAPPHTPAQNTRDCGYRIEAASIWNVLRSTLYSTVDSPPVRHIGTDIVQYHAAQCPRARCRQRCRLYLACLVQKTRKPVWPRMSAYGRVRSCVTAAVADGFGTPGSIASDIAG